MSSPCEFPPESVRFTPDPDAPAGDLIPLLADLLISLARQQQAKAQAQPTTEADPAQGGEQGEPPRDK
jgi:hypothetical protein